MGMRDKVENMEQLRTNLFAALQSDNENQQKEAFQNFAEGLEDKLILEAKGHLNRISEAYADEHILAERGIIKPLTSAEKKYFNAVIERQGFDNFEEAFPETIFDEIFAKLRQEHPILSRIDFRATNALGKIFYTKGNTAKAFWGPISENIKQILIKGIEVMETQSARLSGFIPVSKGMFELGPAWLAKYVITILTEVISAELETGVIAGTGKYQPIGAMKKLSGATDSVYPDKEKIVLANLEPASLAGIRAALAEAKTDSEGVVVMVSPLTYWAKVFPALCFRNADGVWVHDRLATGEKILKSYAVPKDTLIFGDPKNYLLGISGPSRIDRYDQTLAIEDMDLYIAKVFGYGLAKDANAFFVADISGITGATIPTLEKFAVNTGDNKGSIITKTTEKPGV